MGRLSGFKYKEIVTRFRRAGFKFDRQAKGSHEIWYNPESKVRITIPNHPGDIPEETLNAIVKQSGLTVLVNFSVIWYKKMPLVGHYSGANNLYDAVQF